MFAGRLRFSTIVAGPRTREPLAGTLSCKVLPGADALAGLRGLAARARVCGPTSLVCCGCIFDSTACVFAGVIIAGPTTWEPLTGTLSCKVLPGADALAGLRGLAARAHVCGPTSLVCCGFVKVCICSRLHIDS